MINNNFEAKIDLLNCFIAIIEDNVNYFEDLENPPKEKLKYYIYFNKQSLFEDLKKFVLSVNGYLPNKPFNDNLDRFSIQHNRFLYEFYSWKYANSQEEYKVNLFEEYLLEQLKGVNQNFFNWAINKNSFIKKETYTKNEIESINKLQKQYWDELKEIPKDYNQVKFLIESLMYFLIRPIDINFFNIFQ